jgi:phytoene dehydrogenase-like protein
VTDAAWDDVLIGSGINSLVAAALLARAGRRALVLDRNDWVGGAIKTESITYPGYRHDVFSAWHPLFVASEAYQLLGADLRDRGLDYVQADLPTATVLSDGHAAFLSTSVEQNVEEFDRHGRGDGASWRQVVEQFGENADLAFGMLSSELWSTRGALLGVKAAQRLGRRGLARLTGEMMITARDWLQSTFASEPVRALLAPWVLHAGLGPDAATSGFMTQVIASSIEANGIPLPRGGGSRLVDSLVQLIRDSGGSVEVSCDVDKVIVRNGRATGVRLASGRIITARRTVIANVTPTQLYERLLRDVALDQSVRESARRYRYGRAGMQMHIALSEPPEWRGDERLRRTAIIHLTPGLDGVSRAVNEADRGLLPAEGTIVCGQPVAADASRVPPGGSILWVQILDLPSRPIGDAADEIDVGDGSWTVELRELYADRIQRRMSQHIGNLDDAMLQRAVLSPLDLQAANPNLVGGDIFSGAVSIDQNLVWRPCPGLPGHRTPVGDLYHIGASTHPGPGLGAGSGTIVARELLSRSSRSIRAIRALART